ncbi:hypothetical protein MHK_000338, partial [Candidatus Magnetomorum sp. HK-1]
VCKKTIYMYPPNLKIKVERKYKIDQGNTKNEKRKHIIGSGGNALISDDYIVMSTLWFDHDDRPLPVRISKEWVAKRS